MHVEWIDRLKRFRIPKDNILVIWTVHKVDKYEDSYEKLSIYNFDFSKLIKEIQALFKLIGKL